jgi:hypothetical protein
MYLALNNKQKSTFNIMNCMQIYIEGKDELREKKHVRLMLFLISNLLLEFGVK